MTMYKSLAATLAATLAGAALLAPAAAQDRPAPAPAATAPAAQQPAGRAEGLAAIVNDRPITTVDVRQRSNLILVSAGIEPTRETLAQAGPQALRSLIDESLQMQEAERWEIEVTDAEVDAAFANLARSNQVQPDQLAAQLNAAGVGVGTMRNQLRADLAWQRYIGGRFGSRIRISANAIDETRERIVTNAAKPQFLVSEIFLPADGEEEVRQATAAAQRLIAEMRRGAAFPAVARQFSEKPSAATGGDIGWLAQGELEPALQAVIDVMQPGQVSTPIPVEGGVYIVALRDRRAGADPNTTNRVTLAQISAPAAQKAALGRAVDKIAGCEGLAAAAGDVPGAAVTELGEFAPADLSADVAARIQNVAVGGASAVYDGPKGASALVVCARTAGEAEVNRDEIENRLYDQELAMVSQREMRNLREEATIRVRQQ